MNDDEHPPERPRKKRPKPHSRPIKKLTAENDSDSPVAKRRRLSRKSRGKRSSKKAEQGRKKSERGKREIVETTFPSKTGHAVETERRKRGKVRKPGFRPGG